MIEAIRHVVWTAHNPMPYTYRQNLETWRQHHPEWEHRLWTESDLDGLDMVNRGLYDAARTEAPKDWVRWRADIARLEIIYQFGGVYADTDSRAVAPLDPLLEIPCWFAESPNGAGLASNAVFGAEPGHPFIHKLLTNMAASADLHRGERMIHRVGARYVARMVADHPEESELLPWHWFASQAIADRGKTEPVKPVYVDHTYANSSRHEAKPQIAAFHAAADILDASGATWFLSSGMVLGHIREDRILPWDGDVDLGIFPEDAERVMVGFASAGWRFKRRLLSQLQPIHPKTGVKVDIHTYYREGATAFKLLGRDQRIRQDHPAYLFDNLTPSLFYLRDVLVPNPAEEYLAATYGDDWMVPKLDWQWDSSPMNLARI